VRSTPSSVLSTDDSNTAASAVAAAVTAASSGDADADNDDDADCDVNNGDVKNKRGAPQGGRNGKRGSSAY
jgi:hypothetical protein